MIEQKNDRTEQKQSRMIEAEQNDRAEQKHSKKIEQAAEDMIYRTK
jgi:hypothetical protein